MTQVLALAATRRTAARSVPFLKLLGHDATVVSWHRTRQLGADVSLPDAVLATSVALLDELPAVPTAVWVTHPQDLRAAHEADVEVVLAHRADLVDHGAVLVPPVGIDLSRWPPIAPLVRDRWRSRHGLPAELVVAVEHATEAADLAASLALASAAVVTGPSITLALALGTPSVTSPETARRLGLRPGLDVEVAGGPEAADRLAREIAADPARAARLSRRGRRYAENHLDLGRPAAVVRRRLGLAPPAGPGAGALAHLEGRLVELATPAGAPIRLRVDDALALFPPISGDVAS